MRPVVGISTYREPARWGTWDRPADLLPTAYADAIVAAGGCPVLLPPLGDVVTDAVARLDALVLAGGADIEPSRYGADAHASVTVTRPDRDTTELRLLEATLSADLPMLGVCRGAQLLNVATGGDLIQHLPDALDGATHRGGASEFVRQHVTLAPGSRLAGVLGETVDVDCYHHQGIGRLGTGLTVVGSAADGTIEAVELDGHRFVVGVQWHPEESPDSRLFAALVQAADANR